MSADALLRSLFRAKNAIRLPHIPQGRLRDSHKGYEKEPIIVETMGQLPTGEYAVFDIAAAYDLVMTPFETCPIAIIVGVDTCDVRIFMPSCVQ